MAARDFGDRAARRRGVGGRRGSGLCIHHVRGRKPGRGRRRKTDDRNARPETGRNRSLTARIPGVPPRCPAQKFDTMTPLRKDRQTAQRKGESMSTKGKSRRSFLLASVTGLNAAWVAANYPGILAAQEHVRLAAKAGQPPQLTFFTDAQAAEVEAMAAQIIPTDETPGAREAHCILLHRPGAVHVREEQPARVHPGLAGSSVARRKQLYPDAAKFSALTSEQQIKVLTRSRRRRSSGRSARTRSSGSSRARCTAAITTRSAGS